MNVTNCRLDGLYYWAYYRKMDPFWDHGEDDQLHENTQSYKATAPNRCMQKTNNHQQQTLGSSLGSSDRLPDDKLIVATRQVPNCALLSSSRQFLVFLASLWSNNNYET
ncbi:hypothetical protein JTE90_024968 [Oedothorax gibbosus]|uniref:Uncharacterized protein n=1 Tax=Oedothorax gibbosus TaxID=931172 RepID=A0AAV6VUH7_9ARAC|nr:hypothetical protein JTE90_024968 [Oedothorax gibbosus]